MGSYPSTEGHSTYSTNQVDRAVLVKMINVKSTAVFLFHTSCRIHWLHYTSEFESHWVPHSFGLVLHRSKEFRKLLHWLHLCRGGRLYPNKCPGYVIKPSDGEAPALKIWGMQSTPSLPLLPDPLWPGVASLDRVLFMGQIEQTMCANK